MFSAGVGVGFSKLLSRSQNPKKSSDSTTLHGRPVGGRSGYMSAVPYKNIYTDK